MNDAMRSIAVAVIGGLILAGLLALFAKAPGISVFHMLGGAVRLTPESAPAVAQSPMAPGNVNFQELGDHDLCWLSHVNIQSKEGNSGCYFTHTNRAWTLHAERQDSAPGSQAVCNATCADVK